MKKILFLLLISVSSYAQTTIANKLKVTGATKNNDATRVVVQDSITKEYHWVFKSTLAGGGGTVTSVTGTDGISVAMGTTTPVIGVTAIAQSKVTELVTDLAGKEDVSNKDNGTLTTSSTTYPTSGAVKTVTDANTTAIATKQNTLVSGTNIKTVNGTSLLGSGDITISGGGSSKFMNATGFDGYGDSITFGMNSSPTSNSYINLLGTLYTKTIVNRAVSGRGIWEATKQHFANVTTATTTTPIVMAGFNDVRRGGNSAKTTAKIINGYKSIIVNQFLSYFQTGQTTTNVTKSGTWNSNYAGIGVGAKTNNGTFSNTNGGYIEYAFTDNNVVVGLIGGDGVTQIHADFTVLIDGVSQGSFSENNQTDGISDGANDNARSAMCLNFNGLSDGTHTIRLTNTTGNYLIVDYFGHLKQPKFCTPIVVMQAPKMDATGYAVAPNLASDAIINQLNTDIASVVASFPSSYPIVLGKTNDYYNVATGLDITDHIHPNNIGHRQIYEASYTALNPLMLSPTAGVSVSANNAFTGLNTFTQEVKATAGFQSKGSFNVATISGAGSEMEFAGGIAYFTGYDRTNLFHVPVVMRSKTFSINTYNGTGGGFGVEKLKIFENGNTIIQNGGTFTDDGVNRLQIGGSIKATQHNISALNTAPSSATDVGVLGEIRYDANYMYLCVSTNTWKRSALTTW